MVAQTIGKRASEMDANLRSSLTQKHDIAARLTLSSEVWVCTAESLLCPTCFFPLIALYSHCPKKLQEVLPVPSVFATLGDPGSCGKLIEKGHHQAAHVRS